MEQPDPRVLLRRAARLIPALLAAWAFLHMLSFTAEFGLNVPCADGWPYVELHEKYNAGTLTFSDLFAMHNEHLFFVPRVLFVAIGAVTHVNLMAQTYLSHVELLVTFLVIWLSTARQLRRRWFEMPWWFVPSAFLLFNLGQWRNLICSFQSGFITSIPLSVLAYYALSRHCQIAQAAGRVGGRSAIWFALAIASGALASFSTAMGLAVWPAGALVLLLGRDKPLGPGARGYAAGWVLATLLVGGTFTHYYRASMGHTHQVERVTAELVEVIGALPRFCLNLLGSPLSSSPAASVGGGAALLALLLWCLVELVRSGRVRRNVFNLACVVQVLGTLAMIAVGRIHLGDDYAQQSRYVTLIVPLWVGVVGMAGSLIQPQRTGEPSPGLTRGALLLGASLCLTSVAAATAWVDGPTLGAQKQANLAKMVKKMKKSRGPDHVYVERWQAVGVSLDP